MKEIKIKMQIEYDGYYCEGTNIYEYKNETELKIILVREYFKVLELRYTPLYINSYLGYGSKNKIIEYTHEDFINDLIKVILKTSDNEDNDLYFIILDKMKNSKSFEEFTSYINGLKEGLEWERGC